MGGDWCLSSYFLFLLIRLGYIFSQPIDDHDGIPRTPVDTPLDGLQAHQLFPQLSPDFPIEQPIDLHPVVGLLSDPRITPEMLHELSNLGIDCELEFVSSLSSLTRSFVQLKPPKPNKILTSHEIVHVAHVAHGVSITSIGFPRTLELYGIYMRNMRTRAVSFSHADPRPLKPTTVTTPTTTFSSLLKATDPEDPPGASIVLHGTHHRYQRP